LPPPHDAVHGLQSPTVHTPMIDTREADIDEVIDTLPEEETVADGEIG
jgi:hypothetical protein